MVSDVSKLTPIIAAKHKEDKLVETVEKAVINKVIATLKNAVADKKLDIKA
jgi:hypothetical protein